MVDNKQRRRKRGSLAPSGAEGAGNEINTVYGDMITFIMVLFILLFVLSYNEKKDEDFLTQMQLQFGGKKVEQEEVLTSEALFVSKLQGYIQQESLNDVVKILVDEQKIKLILSPPVLFDSGKARIKKSGSSVLQGLGDIIKETKNPIIVEGHTDTVPIHNREFANNWELSFGRAFAVVKFLMDQFGFSPKQLSGLGYGEHQPIAPNDTSANRARNRRIEINIIRISIRNPDA